MAKNCVELGITVHIFLAQHRENVDLSALDVLPRITGGTLAIYPKFRVNNDHLKLCHDCFRICKSCIGFSCSARLRTSKGLTASSLDRFLLVSGPEFRLGAIDNCRAFSYLLHSSKQLPSAVFFQFAVLFTSLQGERRLRILNLCLPTSSLASNIFRFADLETTVSLWIKEILNRNFQNIAGAQQEFTRKCKDLLLAYRTLCVITVSSSQLIIPDTFKLLPVYCLAAIKSKIFTGTQHPSDRKHYLGNQILTGGVQQVITILYPRLAEIWNLDGQYLPSLWLPVCHTSLRSDAIYVADNGVATIIWAGKEISDDKLNELFGDPLDQANLSKQLSKTIPWYEQRHNGYLPVMLLIHENKFGNELEFGNMLIEDCNNNELSYHEYLCFLHSEIKNKLDNK